MVGHWSQVRWSMTKTLPKPTEVPDHTLSSLAWWTVASNAAYVVPMVYACQRQEWLRAALLLGLTVASTGYHYVTEAQYDDTAWTLADHILSSVTAVAVALSWPLSRNEWPLACGVNVCNAVAVGCVAGDVLKEGCVAGSFVLVSLVLGARRVRLVLQHTSKILLGLVAATVVMAGVVMADVVVVMAGGAGGGLEFGLEIRQDSRICSKDSTIL